MKRRLFNLAVVASLLLCIATVALWARSYSRYDRLEHVGGDLRLPHRSGITSSFGGVDLYDGHYGADYSVDGVDVGRGWRYLTYPSPTEHRVRTFARQSTDRSFSIMGFGYLVNDRAAPTRYSFRAIWFPDGFLALIFAVLPALQVRAMVRARRQHRVGLCPSCGYDLRESPERCPECGSGNPARMNAS